MDAQQYVDEEEGIDTGTDSKTDQNWGRRNTQVAPEGMYFHGLKPYYPIKCIHI